MTIGEIGMLVAAAAQAEVISARAHTCARVRTLARSQVDHQRKLDLLNHQVFGLLKPVGYCD